MFHLANKSVSSVTHKSTLIPVCSLIHCHALSLWMAWHVPSEQRTAFTYSLEESFESSETKLLCCLLSNTVLGSKS